MGATILCWTDRSPGTIINVWEHHGRTHIRVREDDAKRIDNNGLSESQTYEYTGNPRGRQHVFRREPGGQWQAVHFNETTKRWSKVEGEGLRIGERSKYHDFSF